MSLVIYFGYWEAARQTLPEFLLPRASPGKDVRSGYDAYYMGTKFSRFEPRALASPFSVLM